MFSISVNTVLESATVDIFMKVSLLEKQNWYCGDHSGKIIKMYWQRWWTVGEFKGTPTEILTFFQIMSIINLWYFISW